jgi:phage baseplate assembly protein W
MAGISPVLPLTSDEIDGIQLTQTIKQVTFQNLKNLLLTNPGERVDSNYGVGLKRYLFEPLVPETLNEIKTKISQQARLYVRNVDIVSIRTTENVDNLNKLSIIVYFTIPSLRSDEVFSLPVTT